MNSHADAAVSRAMLADQEARTRIVTRTDETLFVDAGAGSGKTKSLVDRVLRLVLHDDILLRRIAAVTFTEKAGAELRDRLRVEFEKASRLADSLRLGGLLSHQELDDAVTWIGVDPREVMERGDRALDDLDAAAIGTLHSFAQRILGEFPIQAGLPPVIEVLDEVASSVAFDERWAQEQARLLDDEVMLEPFQLATATGVKLNHLRSLARLFGKDWDLVSDRVLVGEDPSPYAMPDVMDLAAEAQRVVALAGLCTKDDDKYLVRLDAFGAWGERLAAAVDAGQRLEVLQAAARLATGHGVAKNWQGRLPEVKQACEELKDRAKAVVTAVNEAMLRTLARWIAAGVREAADERRAEGRLEFHDLLVLSRDLLRHDGDVRDALSKRYQRLLLDEFQDTDPIQIELAVRIAGGRDAGQDRWEDVVVPPGRLFVVGDPKQSIYRFRRADIGMYLTARDVLGGTGSCVSLTTNFRTVAPILDWVNEVFGSLISEVSGQQPEYMALDGDRPGEPNSGPAVVVLGAKPHEEKIKAPELRELEAADVAAVVREALDERKPWRVFDARTKQWRNAEPKDVAVLVPARTSLPFLESAFDEAGVAYRAESSSLVYVAQEVRDLLTGARALADPSDALALVTTLRSPLFGCGDDDLWTWKRDGGRFNLLSRPKEGDHERWADHPVGLALTYLRRLAYEARWMAPSEVLVRLVADRRMLEVAAATAGTRARDQWRRLRFVVDQARAWSESEHGGLRAYLAWAARQGEETARVAEAVLPETDTDAVRIMTVHAAKGLEFPIVVLTGMSAENQRQSGVRVLWPDTGGYAVAIRADLATGDFAEAIPVDEQMSDLERRRLLYVAATRARDHLVVSLHRTTTKKYRNSELLADSGAASAELAVSYVPSDDVGPISARRDQVDLPPEYRSWLDSLTRVRDASTVPSSVSASGLEGSDPDVVFGVRDGAGGKESDSPIAVDLAAMKGGAAASSDAVTSVDPGSAKGGRSVELPAWSKGRYGSAIGRAVHGVLQTVDLATGAGLDEAVIAQCLAEAVTDYEAAVRALAQSALDSDVVKAAARRPHWRETYMGTVTAVEGAFAGKVLEGFVDLIYRDDDGSLVVVDYKTDDIPDEALSKRTAFYAPQISSYTTAIEAITASSSVDGRLLFLRGTMTGHQTARTVSVAPSTKGPSK